MSNGPGESSAGPIADQAAAEAALGPPTLRSEDGRVWIYERSPQRDWLEANGLEVSPPPNPVAVRNPQFEILYFTDSGSFVEASMIDVDGRCDDGVCIYKAPMAREVIPTSTYLGVFTVEAEETAVRPRSDQHCSVYLYSGARWSDDRLRTWIDGSPAGWLLSRRNYRQWLLEPGRREVYVRSGENDGLLRFDCLAGQQVFLRYTDSGNGSLEAVADGARALDGRRALVQARIGLPPGSEAGVSPDMTLAWLRPGELDRDGLVRRLGEPHISSKDGSLAAYSFSARDWAAATGLDVSDAPLYDIFVLQALFDGRGKLSDFNISNANTVVNRGAGIGSEELRVAPSANQRRYPVCSGDLLCAAATGAVTRFSNGEENTAAQKEAARRLSVNAASCTAYLWSGSERALVRVVLDDAVEGFLYDDIWPDGFFGWRLPPGRYELRVDWLNAGPELVSAQVELPCVAGRATKVEVLTARQEVELRVASGLEPPTARARERRYVPSDRGIVDAPASRYPAPPRSAAPGTP